MGVVPIKKKGDCHDVATGVSCKIGAIVIFFLADVMGAAHGEREENAEVPVQDGSESKEDDKFGEQDCE